jgi:hypothetical protein
MVDRHLQATPNNLELCRAAWHARLLFYVQLDRRQRAVLLRCNPPRSETREAIAIVEFDPTLNQYPREPSRPCC